MDTNLALVLLCAPFLGFLINVFIGKQCGKTLSGVIGTSAVLISFAITIYFFLQINQTAQPISISLFDWIQINNFHVNFGFLLDQLSILWLLFVTGIGSLIHLYSISYMHDDEKMHTFFAYLNLFIFFMITLVIGSNLLVMFIGWEGVGLCSYLLIGFWYKNQDFNDAAKKAFIMNRIGDLGLLIGIFILASLFSTLDFTTLKIAITGTNADSYWLGIAALALFIGACGKSAQIPLYTWLPDAMAGPTPVSALIHAATMVTAGIFMVTRLNFLFDVAPEVQNIIAIIGAITALVAATIGLVQNDIKKVLAYSTVSQLGLMFLALGMGAYQVAVFHVITHAFFKACLFLGSGSVIHALGGEQDMRRMGGLRKAMPTTFWTMMIASLAIAGIFPFAGFWSKDEILISAFKNGNIIFWIIASIASILTAFYMFRLMYLTFFKEFRGTEHQKSHLHESPSLITIPLVILAILSTLGGLINLPTKSWLNEYLAPLFSKVAHEEHTLGSKEITLMAIALAGAIIGIIIARMIYIQKNTLPKEDTEMKGFAKVLYHKYYVDEHYDVLFVKPINTVARFFRDYIETTISNVIFGFGKLIYALGFQGKKLQSGSIGFYLFAFVLGFCIIISYLFLAQ